MPQSCALYHGDPGTIATWLTQADQLALYQERLQSELVGLADRGMLAHVRQMGRWAAEISAHGITAVHEREPAAVDALLTDAFAVALWHGDDLPVRAVGQADIAVNSLVRGLLGSDVASDGAGLWLLPDGRIAFSRQRESGELADPAERGCGGSC